MDPISQGLAGAVFPQSISSKNEIGKATLIGLVSGIAADLDVFIKSTGDPLLFIDYHRQFTHSLVFIPVGGFVMAVIFWLLFKKKLKFPRVFLYSTLGYATHCLLDACTTYGTELLWPFSNKKIAWNNIAVIDPVFTVVLAALVISALVNKSVLIARLGVLFCVFYLLFGLYQQNAAEKYLSNIAAIRGHSVDKILVHPTLGNLLRWRGIYLNGDSYHVDGIRVLPFAYPVLYEGSSVRRFSPEEEYPGLDKDSVLFKDIMRFNHFAGGYLVKNGKNTVGDLRYSAFPNSTNPLWSIEVDTDRPDEHVIYSNNFGGSRNKLSTLWKMIKGLEIN